MRFHVPFGFLALFSLALMKSDAEAVSAPSQHFELPNLSEVGDQFMFDGPPQAAQEAVLKMKQGMPDGGRRVARFLAAHKALTDDQTSDRVVDAAPSTEVDSLKTEAEAKSRETSEELDEGAGNNQPPFHPMSDFISKVIKGMLLPAYTKPVSLKTPPNNNRELIERLKMKIFEEQQKNNELERELKERKKKQHRFPEFFGNLFHNEYNKLSSRPLQLGDAQRSKYPRVTDQLYEPLSKCTSLSDSRPECILRKLLAGSKPTSVGSMPAWIPPDINSMSLGEPWRTPSLDATLQSDFPLKAPWAPPSTNLNCIGSMRFHPACFDAKKLDSLYNSI